MTSNGTISSYFMNKKSSVKKKLDSDDTCSPSKKMKLTSPHLSKEQDEKDEDFDLLNLVENEANFIEMSRNYNNSNPLKLNEIKNRNNYNSIDNNNYDYKTETKFLPDFFYYVSYVKLNEMQNEIELDLSKTKKFNNEDLSFDTKNENDRKSIKCFLLDSW